MSEALIDEIAASFLEQKEYINSMITNHESARDHYEAQWKDSVCALARIIFKRTRKRNYDIEMFYKNCGYEGSHPVHI